MVRLHVLQAQFVNEQAIIEAPSTLAEVEVRSGEHIDWTLLQLCGPIPLAYAHANYGNALLGVAAAGPAPTELPDLLGQLTRLRPSSQEITDLVMRCERTATRSLAVALCLLVVQAMAMQVQTLLSDRAEKKRSFARPTMSRCWITEFCCDWLQVVR